MGILHRLSPNFLRYAIAGLTNRLTRPKKCPDCGHDKSICIDRKGFHGFYTCSGCGINYRYPYETAAEMTAFYQSEYGDGSIATDVPSDAQLQRLVEHGASGTIFDRSWHLRVFSQLGMKKGSRVLDFGTSWGYFTLALQQAGCDAFGFEISEPRANVGVKLGVKIYCREIDIPKNLDIVCSTHVIEHVPKPMEKLRQMLSWVKPGGTVIAYTPNGGIGAQRKVPTEFHRAWGRVHPVLLSSDCLVKAFPHEPLLMTSDDSPENLARWDGRSRMIDSCEGAGLLLVIRRPELTPNDPA